MCRRICLARDLDEIRRHFAVAHGKAQLKPHWNIAAGDALPTVRWGGAIRRLDIMRWGLVEAWAQNTLIVRSCFHVQNDEAGKLDQRLFRRCLVAADNFYEWRRADKQPFAVALKGRQIMALAGVWDFWISPLGGQIACFALLTTDANSALAPLSPRMPVLVRPEDWDLWLNPDSPLGEVRALAQATAVSTLDIWAVDRRLSNARNDNPGLLAAMEY